MPLAEKIQALYARFGAEKGITIELHKQLIAVSVRNEAAAATLFLQGAQLAEYCRLGEKPLLWLSDHCDYQAATALRGGVPVCWPWFGDPLRNPLRLQQQLGESDLPMHGLVREREWQLVAISQPDSETTWLTLELDFAAEPAWPYPARLQLEVCIGPRLEYRFSVTNTGKQAFCYTTALHTYFNLSRLESVEVRGLEGQPYLDTLDDWQQHCSVTPLRINAEVDRVYTSLPGRVEICDQGYNRRIGLQAEGAPDMVVWNPWIDKSRRLSHFGEQDYQRMLCLETACLLDNMICLEPEQSHCLRLQIDSLPQD
ncbi:D-hexose-6-phosphate mutarotase [Neptuniibacter halophilus]|uniref:D-hexose-6-phosphate mutarotase n=1 Tax=Neptuniibacter halophilus TaxID=651666 RepID=UPI00257408F4|nr:D-hexose-6-phosphate mutarotase [Neptuniibacter halophilus]